MAADGGGGVKPSQAIQLLAAAAVRDFPYQCVSEQDLLEVKRVEWCLQPQDTITNISRCRKRMTIYHTTTFSLPTCQYAKPNP